MKHGFIAPITLIFSILLIISGTYLVIDNMIHHYGFLFEGIMTLSMGFIMLMTSLIVITLNKTIEVFSKIFEQQVEIQEKLLYKITKKPDFELFPGKMTITDLDTGEVKNINNENDLIKKMNDIITGKVENPIENPTKINPNKKLKDMTQKELETALSEAIENDKFEIAEKIKTLLDRFNLDSDSDSTES